MAHRDPDSRGPALPVMLLTLGMVGMGFSLLFDGWAFGCVFLATAAMFLAGLKRVM